MQNPIPTVWHGVMSLFRAQQLTVAGWIGGQYGYEGLAQRNLTRFWQHYVSNEVVFAAVTETTSASSIIPHQVETRDGPEAWRIAPPDHIIQERLDFPNSDQDAMQFREEADTQLVVSGNAIVAEMPTSGGGGLGELVVLPTRNVFLDRDEKTRRVINYIHDPKKTHGGPNPTMFNRPSDEAQVFPRDRIIHRIYAPDPWTPGWGVGPLAAALDAIEADINITMYIKEFFRVGAVPPHLFISEMKMDLEQERQLQKRWEANVGGVQNAWRMAVISGQNGKIERLGLAPGSREIGLKDLRENTEVRILMALNVPPAVVGAAMGIQFSTYTNYGQARQQMHEENTDPLIQKRDSAFTHYYQKRLNTREIRVRSDLSNVLAVQDRKLQRSEMATREVQSGLIMRNEGRRLIGLPPDETGDTFYVPLNLIPQKSSIVTQQRAQRLTATLGDPEASRRIVREQVADSAASLHLRIVPETLALYIMAEVLPRAEDESKHQFALRVLLATHAHVSQYAREEAAKSVPI